MSRALRLAVFTAAFTLSAQESFLPLKEVRAGMKGVGRSVFAGSKIEEFPVEILGLLENAGPGQTIILGRLDGETVKRAGVLQGMSGSPVYINGRLAGAVALAFQFAREPVCGLRPIEEMARVDRSRRAPKALSAITPWETDLARGLSAGSSGTAGFGESRLVEIATPVSFTGLTAAAVEQFAPRLRELGLEPRQGVSGGGAGGTGMGDTKLIRPGSMISVQLLSGDMGVAADGTVTHVEGGRILAFGHRFVSIGATELPFARAEVLALVPSLASSFKISAAREPVGAIVEDRATAVAGELGRTARTVPLEIGVSSRGPQARSSRYRMRMANDSFLSPLLVQMATFSAIDATERTVSAASFSLRGEIRLAGAAAPVRVANIYSGDVNVVLQASLGAAAPLAFALQSGFDSLKLEGVSLEIDAYAEKRQMQIDQVWTPRREVRPGERVDVVVTLAGDNGNEQVRRVSYTVPPGAASGPLYFTVSDGTTANFTEFRHLLTAPPRSAAQVLSVLNGLRANNNGYVRVWRPDAGYQVQGEDLPSPPPSLALVLSRGPGGAGQSFGRGSKLAEFELGASEAVISGAKTIQVDIKE